MNLTRLAGCWLFSALIGILSAGDVVIDDMKNGSTWTAPKSNPEKVSVTADGISFPGPGIIFKKEFSTYPVDGGNDVYKTCQGIAFKVKGDGGQEWGTLSIFAGPRIGGQIYFPLKDTGVKEYQVSFADMAPASDQTIALPSTLKFGEITELSIGDRWKIGQLNNPRAPFHFQISEIRLLETIKPDFVPGKFRPAPPAAITIPTRWKSMSFYAPNPSEEKCRTFQCFSSASLRNSFPGLTA